MKTLNGAYREVNNLMNQTRPPGLSRESLKDMHYRLHRVYGEGEYSEPSADDLDALQWAIDNLDELWPTTPAPD